MLLELGDAVRYQGMGAGRVVDHVERDFRGETRLMAVIYFPHRQMTAQLPVGDPAIMDRLAPTLNERQIRRYLRSIANSGQILPRTWDKREELGKDVLNKGGPKEWASLLASYSLAASYGVEIAASDLEIVRQIQELFAAELALAADKEFEDSLRLIESSYDKASVLRNGEIVADHFTAVPLQV